ncbi:MAG: hypothetical protein DRJ10_01590 [Bacteroidetes bacterium]|nr:MAG: hypothetical protein DRJ10_01590 [Bacteroidota bacterium]
MPLNNLKKISAVIIVKNSEQVIARTLDSLKDFDEVIIYDNGSMDKTLPIAGHYKNVKIILGEFTGFGNTKNVAAEFAHNNWVFSIDSDEVISSQLYESINNVDLDNNSVYWCYRYNYYRKRRIKYSGWGKEEVSRLYNKNVTHFNKRLVHEGLELKNFNHVKLKGELRHYSYFNIADFNKKRDFYSDLFALENKGIRKSSPLLAFISGSFDFLNTYITKLAFLDGYRGLLIAISNAHETFLKHLKLYEANLKNNYKVSLIITSCGNKDALELCLKSALNQFILPNEILIINAKKDKESHELITEFAKKSFIPVSYFEDESQNNIASLRNKAISKTRHDYLIFVDSNSILHKDFIIDHISCAKRGAYIQGKLVKIKEELSLQLINTKQIKLPGLFSGNYKNIFKGVRLTFLSKFYCLVKKKRPNGVGVYNFSLFKEDIIKVNGFNEDYNEWSLIDREILERLCNKGVRRIDVRFRAIQYHLSKSDVGSESVNKLKTQIENEKNIWCNNGLDKYLPEILKESKMF